MLTPIVCITCGTSIGHVASIFNAVKVKLRPEEVKDVMRLLGITSPCCIPHILCAIPITEIRN